MLSPHLESVVEFAAHRPEAAWSGDALRWMLRWLVSSPDMVFDRRGADGRVAAVVMDGCESATDSAELIVVARDGGESQLAGLLDWAAERARSAGRRWLEVAEPGSSPFSEPQLRRVGFEPGYSMLTLERAVEGSDLADVPAPDGLRFVEAGPERIEALHALVAQAFSKLPGAYLAAFDAYRTQVLAAPRLPRLLVHGDDVVAFARLAVDGDAASLQSIGCEREWRGRGLGALMLREALRMAALAGARRLSLEVYEHNRPARALYERTGFRQAGRATTWRRALPPYSSSPGAGA